MNAGRGETGEGRSEPTRLNRWRRSLAESMPYPGPAQPGRAAKPLPWPTGEGTRRPERRGGGSALRGGRARDARGAKNDKCVSVRLYRWRFNRGFRRAWISSSIAANFRPLIDYLFFCHQIHLRYSPGGGMILGLLPGRASTITPKLLCTMAFAAVITRFLACERPRASTGV